MRLALVFATRSSRRRVIELPALALRGLACGAGLLILLSALTLYSTLLHYSLDDWGLSLRANRRKCARKVLRDNGAAIRNVLFASDTPPATGIPAVRLFVNAEDWRDLNRSILRFGLGDLERKPRIGARVLTSGGEALRAKVSYRGSNYWHHAAWKPSLRVRYDKDRLADGFRNHVLIAPESPCALRNWLSSELARRWGELSLEEHHVRVFLNRRYLGLYTRQWRLTESLLCRQGRLPGPFFRLENNTGPCFRHVFASFEDESTWEVSGVDDAEGRERLRTMIAACAIEDPVRRYEALDEIVDRRAVARWLALRAHSGEIHIDEHNFALWLDTTSGLLVPILLDANGYGLRVGSPGHLRPLVYLEAIEGSPHQGNPLERLWLRKPQNLALYMDELHALLEGLGSLEATERLVRETWRRIRPSALADINTSEIDLGHGSARAPYSVTKLDADVEALVRVLHERLPWVEAQLGALRVLLVSREADRFEVLVVGPAGARARDLGGREHLLLPSLRQGAEPPALTPIGPEGTWAFGLFTLPGEPEDYTFANRLTGVAAELEEPPPAQRPDFARWRRAGGFPARDFESPQPAPVVLGPGEVRITETRVFASGQAVTIRAGTRLLLAPETSLLIRGRLRVEGTVEAPVKVRPLDPKRGFGVLAVYGPESGGTELKYLDCEGGTTARRHNLFFTGMISIHDCPELKIHGSRFGETLGGDDTLHVARSVAEVTSSTFEGTRSDALDWDKVEGRIVDCSFRKTGNDAVDASMSQVLVERCRFDSVGDKGISAGEGSRVRVRDCEFRAAVIGVAAKDRSRVWVTRSSFEDCQSAVSAYRKKWRWEQGGEVSLSEVSFRGSVLADLSGDGRSTILTTQAREGIAVVGSVQVVTRRAQ